jgi:hypothetical protein
VVFKFGKFYLVAADIARLTQQSNGVSGLISPHCLLLNNYFYWRTMKALTIKRGSSSHLALLYLKMKRSMKNSSCSVDGLYKLSPNKYKKRYRAKNALDFLVTNGLASCHNDMYYITDNGVKFLPVIISNQKYKYSD